MPRFGEYESFEILAYGPSSAVFSARCLGDETGDESYVVRVFQEPLGVAPDRAALERKAFVDRVQVQRAMSPEAGASAADRHWVPILQTDDGSADTEAWAVTPRYELHAGQLIDGRARLSEHDLYTLVEGVVRGLLELRDVLDRAHGNLGPNNVLLRRPPDGHGWRADLADPIESARLRPHHDEVADLRAVGQLIDGLVTHRRTVDLGVESGALRQRWRALGRRGGRWRELCETLLDPAAAAEPLDLDGLAARLEALRPVAPQVRRRRVQRWGGGVLALVAIAIAAYLLWPKPASVQDARVACEQILCAMPWLQDVSDTLDGNRLPENDWTEVRDLLTQFKSVRADLKSRTAIEAASDLEVHRWREIRTNREQYLGKVEQLDGPSRDHLIVMRDTIEAIKSHLIANIHEKLTGPAEKLQRTYGWTKLPDELHELAQRANPAPDFEDELRVDVPEDDEPWVDAWADMETRAKELAALNATIAQLEKDAEEWGEGLLACWKKIAAEGALLPDVSSFGRGLIRESSSISETKDQLETLREHVDSARGVVGGLGDAFGAVTETEHEREWQGRVVDLLGSVVKSIQDGGGPPDLSAAIGKHVARCRQVTDKLMAMIPDSEQLFESLWAAKFASDEIRSAYEDILRQRRAEFDFSVSAPAPRRRLHDDVSAFVEHEGTPFKKRMMELDAFVRREVVSAADEDRFQEMLRQKADGERRRRVAALLATLNKDSMSQLDVEPLEAKFEKWLEDRQRIAGLLGVIDGVFANAGGLDDEIGGAKLIDTWKDTVETDPAYRDTFEHDEDVQDLKEIVNKLAAIREGGAKPGDFGDKRPAVAWAAWRWRSESEVRPAQVKKLVEWAESVTSAIDEVSDEQALRDTVVKDLQGKWKEAAARRASERDLGFLEETRADCRIESLRHLDERLQFDLALHDLVAKTKKGEPTREDLVAALGKFIKATESLALQDSSTPQSKLVETLAALRDAPVNPPIDWSDYGPGKTKWECTEVGEGVLQFSGQAGGERFTIAFKNVNGTSYVATDEMPVKLALSLGVLGAGGRGARTWSGKAVAERWMPRAADAYPQANPATPDDWSPVQQIGSGEAADLAAELGCRLPTFAEWGGALAEWRGALRDANEAPPNLRDTSFLQFEDRVMKLHSDLPTDNRDYPSPDRGRHLFEEREHDDDGAVWFRVTAPASHDWQNLVGNVAEFVTDGGAVKIVGGSAFGGDETSVIDDTRPSYSDVGLRLAFSGPQAPETLQQKVTEALQDPPYSFSPPTR